MFCDVIVDLTTNQVNKTFEYNIPSWLEGVLEVGHRVLVPFGPRKLMGFVVKIKDESSFGSDKLKDVIDVLDIEPVLNEELINIAYFMVKNYYTFYITAILALIPTALKVNYTKKVKILDNSGINEEILSLFNNNELVINDDNKKHLKYFKQLEQEKKVVIVENVKNKKNAKTIKMVTLLDGSIRVKSKKGNELIQYLYEINEDIQKSSLTNDMGYSNSVINTLIENKAIHVYDYEVYRDIERNKNFDTTLNTLNQEQQNAYDQIIKNSNKGKTFLIHGVTGSGKTEIYLNLIKDVLSKGREAIVLVPEIGLTVQTINRFKGIFKNEVAVLHSRLSIGEKYDEWRKIIRKEAKIAIGARSAIFAPFTNLGIIIIDEEHEGSYMQDVNPKYRAIDIALERIKHHNASLVLGSATPSIISYYKALENEYELITLRNRANKKPLPKIEVVDMREEIRNGNMSMFSKSLLTEIKESFVRNEQSILFLNRRGFSTFVMCRECGQSIKCPNCDVSLTFHASTNRLKCHYCGYEQNNVNKCPHCESRYIRFVGNGTQKIESELKKLIPEIRTLRVDYDTTQGKFAHENLLNSFKNHEYDVLIGTQIVAKGLDFPMVTLVGVVNADIGLKLPDYDTFETTYDILEQVSGRAGRSELEGKVIIQTYDPSHYSIVHAKNHNYFGFYQEEIRLRKMLFNPPFSIRVEIVVSSSEKTIARNTSNDLIKMIKNTTNGIYVYGPSEALIFRVNNNYRYLVTIKFIDKIDSDALNNIIEFYQSKPNVDISITRR